ncbi:MAG: GGDEF domain-containing protein [Lachnospiraceae bacterium]|nr:GGDEF domain-containing protein [Lachnospiraceae bacterium]
MGFDYFVFYTEASAICVIILLMILITDRIYNTQQEKQIWFGRAIVAFILYFISDACWASMLSDQFPKVRFFAVLFNFTNYIFLGLMAYGMFMFIAATEKMPFRKSIWKRCLVFSPIVLSALFIAIAYMTNPLFWINENNELNDLYFPFLISVPSCYLLAGFILSVKYALKSELKEEKRQFLFIGIVPLSVGAFGMIQVIALNAPTFCFGCTLMWLWFYIQNMQSLISVDDLTHLNNRGQINRYLEQLHYSEDTQIYIMMLDIDRFKGINDTYGHAEGDRALILFSDALRQTCEQIKSPVFLGRYGGDEFTIVLQTDKDRKGPEEVVRIVRELLREKRKENQLPYDLGCSIGYDTLKDKPDTVRDCLKRADEKLYKDKHRLNH